MARRVWITGASEGIGRACAEVFASNGARLAICARRAQVLDPCAEKLRALGAGEVCTIAIDVGNREGAARFAEQSLDALGGCDVLIHNAGGGGPCRLFEADDDSFEKEFRYAFELNLMGAARLARAAASALTTAKGTIILVSSAWSLEPIAITPASYGCTKAGLNHLTRIMAQDLGPRGIRVVGVAPGPVWTESWERDLLREAKEDGCDPETLRTQVLREQGAPTDLGRPAKPQEIAEAIYWLAGPHASYITGTTIRVDGGFVNSVR